MYQGGEELSQGTCGGFDSHPLHQDTRASDMSLDKAIRYGKEKRKRYYGSKAFDCSCRNHGTCKWCLGNRTVRDRRRRQAADEQIEEMD